MPELTYFGHSAFQIKSGSGSILIDPFISGNPLATVSKEDLNPDYIIITHGHSDHVGDALEISKSTGAPIISNFEIASYFSGLGAKTEAMHIGGSREFPFGKVKLTIAHHGSGLTGPDGEIIYLGNPCGVIISTDGKNVYHAGDTGLFLDMKLIGEMTSIDVALLPIGDNFTMGVEDAVKAAEFLQARVNVPMHYNTFDLIKTDPDTFVEGVKALNLDAVIIEPGGSLDI